MNISFLKREEKSDEIEWGIIPLYLMAIRESSPILWRHFVRMINAVDDRSLDEALENKEGKNATR